MADFGTFNYGGTAYPLTASTANSLLRDADPSLYYALDYFAAMITRHVGARLIAETAGFSSPITAAVVQVAPMDPAPYLLQQQFQFPLLVAYRVKETYGRRTVTWQEDVSEWQVAYILPPLTQGQAERIKPILRSVAITIRDRIENQFDPSYSAGLQVWKAAGLEQIDLTEGTYGAYQAIDSTLYFPSWTGKLVVKERQKPETDFQKFSGQDVAIDLAGPTAATVLDIVDVTLTYLDPTTIANVAAWLKADAGLTVQADGFHISGWTDSSALGNSAAQASATNQPIELFKAINLSNGVAKPLLRFDGAAAFLTAPAATMATDSGKTVVVLSRLNSLTARQSVALVTASGDTGASTAGIEANTLGTAGGRFGVYLGGSSYDTGSATDQLWHVHTLRVSNTASGQSIATTTTYRIDGAVQTLTRQTGTGLWQGMAASNQIAIGALPTSVAATALSGDVAIVLPYARALSDAECSQVERYALAWLTNT